MSERTTTARLADTKHGGIRVQESRPCPSCDGKGYTVELHPTLPGTSSGRCVECNGVGMTWTTVAAERPTYGVTIYDVFASIRGRLTRLHESPDDEPRWYVRFPDSPIEPAVMYEVELEVIDEIGELSCVIGAGGGE